MECPPNRGRRSSDDARAAAVAPHDHEYQKRGREGVKDYVTDVQNEWSGAKPCVEPERHHRKWPPVWAHLQARRGLAIEVGGDRAAQSGQVLECRARLDEVHVIEDPARAKQRQIGCSHADRKDRDYRDTQE
jgi:hypothetical protein